MAYTTLPTQSAGQTASAAGWANLVKADIESMMHLHARKSSDESVASSTTLQDDNDLALTVAASEVWEFRLHIIYTAAAAADIKFAWTFPTGGVMAASGVGLSSTDVFSHYPYYFTTSPTSALTYGGADATIRDFSVEGTFTNSTTPGTLQLQWAQQASSGTASVVKANSTLWVCKLA